MSFFRVLSSCGCEDCVDAGKGLATAHNFRTKAAADYYASFIIESYPDAKDVRVEEVTLGPLEDCSDERNQCTDHN